ncbi:hypothetical protein B9Z55_028360 [Caenorhabditis nigoni]|nr:hypothetical protein B9Z55_028360 [Caenorhabditis nigoni]
MSPMKDALHGILQLLTMHFVTLTLNGILMIYKFVNSNLDHGPMEVFYLPCESHQKIQLCISVLVALTIYFLMLIDIIPPTSIVTPLILKYLSFTMVMVALSVTCTVFQVNALSAMNILEKQFQKTLFELEIATMAKKSTTQTPKTVNAIFLELPMLNRSVSVKIRKPSVKAVRNRVRRLLSIDMTDDVRGKESEEISPETVKDTDPDREKLRKAERNIHFIAKTLTDERKAEEVGTNY